VRVLKTNLPFYYQTRKKKKRMIASTALKYVFYVIRLQAAEFF
jgi:hypothetical protein